LNPIKKNLSNENIQKLVEMILAIVDPVKSLSIVMERPKA
jgi:hypothetical protein